MKNELIGLDLDGVICNTPEATSNYLKDRFNLYLDKDKDFICYEFEKNPNFTSYIAECLNESVHNGDMFVDALPYEDVWDGLALLKKYGFDIHIITSRGHVSNGKEVRKITLDWLNKYKIIYDKIDFIRTRDKAKLVKEMDIKAFVEDRFDVLNMVLEECGVLPYGLIIRDQPWNRKFYNEDVYRAFNFKEACYAIIENRSRELNLRIQKEINNYQNFVR
jgi:uncharacterized HAD superfamily protein